MVTSAHVSWLRKLLEAGSTFLSAMSCQLDGLSGGKEFHPSQSEKKGVRHSP